jgi:hypothetical protein
MWISKRSNYETAFYRVIAVLKIMYIVTEQQRGYVHCKER